MRSIQNLVCFMIVAAFSASGLLFFNTTQAEAGAPCLLNIIKMATPSDGTEFPFTCASEGTGECGDRTSFSLENGQVEENISLDINPLNNEVTVVEFPPDGWILDRISCDIRSGDGIMSFDTDAVENGVVAACLVFDVIANCTFNNIRGCQVTIEKSALEGGDTPFGFTAPGSSDPEFTLTDGEEIILGIAGGTDVDVTELAPDGWSLSGVQCSEPDGVVISNFPNGSNFACSPDGGSVDCVFVNVPSSQIPTVSEWGLIGMAAILGIIALLAIRRRNLTA